MKEALLHYIWQNQLFDKQNLITEEGDQLTIIKPGILNHESGPDFLQAQLQIGSLIWFGAVEIHVETSNWRHHRHQNDPAYDKVILHVVWQHNADAIRKDGSAIPTLSLAGRVQADVLRLYERLVADAQSKKKLNCSHFLKEVPTVHKISSLERAAINRLTRKGEEVLMYYRQHGQDWHQAALQSLSTAYGFKTNAAAFSTMGARVSSRQLLKESKNFASVAGIFLYTSALDDPDKISTELLRQTQHMSIKYDLSRYRMQAHQFKHFPVRPSNAPMIRLLQLSALVYCHPDIFSLLSSSFLPDNYYQLFRDANKILHAHRPLNGNETNMGKESMQRILINGVAPFQYALGQHTDNAHLQQVALDLLEKLPAESNRYTRIFEQQGFQLKSALDSQGAIEQYRFHCEQNLCLRCPVGSYVMKNHDLVVN